MYPREIQHINTRFAERSKWLGISQWAGTWNRNRNALSNVSEFTCKREKKCLEIRLKLLWLSNHAGNRRSGKVN